MDNPSQPASGSGANGAQRSAVQTAPESAPEDTPREVTPEEHPGEVTREEHPREGISEEESEEGTSEEESGDRTPETPMVGDVMLGDEAPEHRDHGSNAPVDGSPEGNGTEERVSEGKANEGTIDEKSVKIAQLVERLAQKELKEGELLTELTELMDNYAALDKTLGAVKELNMRHVLKIEEQADELRSLQSTLGTLKCCEAEQKDYLAVLKQQLLSAVECSVCLCVFLRPITLSCGHSFCQKCLEDVKSSSGSVCALCREPSLHTVRSAALNNASEIIREFETRACNM